MAEIDKILKIQERELLKLEDREVKAFLKSYTASRRELRDRLDAITVRGEGNRWTAQHTRIALAEVEDGIRVMQGQLGTVLSAQAIQRRDLALKHLTQTIGHFEPEFLGTGGGINLGAMRRLSDSGELLLHKYSTSRYSADLMGKIQAELARGHSSRLSRSEVVKRIAGTSSVFTGMEHRAALIDRMENARAYDASFRAGLAEAAEELDEEDDPDPLLKKAVEFIDKRSHPFSSAVDGRVARVGGEWEVPAADVRAAGAKMKKGIGGVLWTLEGGLYKGAAYPAHYSDRGRGIPWRASWGAFRGPIPAAVKVAKPKAVPTPADVQKAAKAKLDRATKALKKAGLRTDVWGVPQSLQQEVRDFHKANPEAGIDSFAGDFLLAPARIEGTEVTNIVGVNGQGLERLISGFRASAARVRSPALSGQLQGFSNTVDRLEKLQTRHHKARTAWLRTLTEKELAPIRKKAIGRMMANGRPFAPKNVSAMAKKASAELSIYPVDLVEYAARNGISIGGEHPLAEANAAAVFALALTAGRSPSPTKRASQGRLLTNSGTLSTLSSRRTESSAERGWIAADIGSRGHGKPG